MYSNNIKMEINLSMPVKTYNCSYGTCFHFVGYSIKQYDGKFVTFE
jgi:hypothetical protein